ncbi:glycosyltransferase [Paraburkholderia flava]|uniref:glycosyltransferase n=1 Tax=Paraburkholderia flava TaxID=2547393 RepID=UPI0014150694|nr:glycosyltransferase [Paraburkholderia flava]
MQEKLPHEAGKSFDERSDTPQPSGTQRDTPTQPADPVAIELSRLELLEREITELAADLASRTQSQADLHAELDSRIREIDVLSANLARTRTMYEKAQSDKVGLRSDFQRFTNVSDQYQAVLASPMWRITGPLRRAASLLSAEQRKALRRMLKAVWWMATPHRTAARLKFLKARREEEQRIAREQSVRDAAGDSSINASRNTNDVAAVQIPRASADAISWFFIGDTIDWLQSHAQLTGVGKVTSELFIASYDAVTGTHARPCIRGDSVSGLVPASYADTVSFLASKLDKPQLVTALQHDDRTSLPRSPQRGDRVLFTGVVWTPDYAGLYKHLAAQGIGIGVFLYDIIPVEHPDLVGPDHYRMFVSWLETTVAYVQTIFVSSQSIREKLIRWATLAGVPLNAEIVSVNFGTSEVEDFATAEQLTQHVSTKSVDLSSFVLSVGTIDRRKNQALLARLWARLTDEVGAENVPQLVLVGRDDIGIASLSAKIASLVASSKIVVLQGISDAELVGLYKACLFTAFPSFSEGYGLPVAESLRYGKVCLSSNLECIHEHAGDFPWYFEPDDEEGAYRLLRRALEDKNALATAERFISQQYRMHSWRETYDAIAGALLNRASARYVRVERYDHPTFPGAAVLDLPVTMAKAGKWCSEIAPDVSVLIINWNAAALTLECVRQLWANTEGLRYEIVIVDNGSRESEVVPLRGLGAGVRVLELGTNRFFGEANNVAAEAATGRYLCLQNNDAFVQPGWLTSLVAAFEQDQTVGAAGPLFLFPDGTIQEAGAIIDENGYPIRFGRGHQTLAPEFLKPLSVDYISAANLLVPRDLFMEVGGFDLQYEPAYYEDVDLCFKIRAIGKTIRYCPDARVIHIEGSSANHNPEAEARRRALGDLNRDKFTSRWGRYLKSRADADLERVRRHFPAPEVSPQAQPTLQNKPERTAVVFTPYALTPGGGERYVLTMAAALSSNHAVSIVTPHPYSQLRLRSLASEFDIDLSTCRLATADQFAAADAPDLMVTMGNHIVPPTPGRGKTNLFLCQFPFRTPDFADPAWLGAYQSIIAYSEYSKAHIFAALSAGQLPPRPIDVLHPPVPAVAGDALAKKRMILSVGRFFIGAHSKRHDLLIKAFRTLYETVDGDIELHLAGSSVPESLHMDYLNRLQQMAEGLPVKFHVNVAGDDLAVLYRDAALYWHGAGLESDLLDHPETAEHFGISIVEAMFAGCVPLSFNSGGPREIITDGVDGFLYGSIGGLVAQSQRLLAATGREMREQVGLAAARRAGDFAVDRFAAHVRELVERRMADRPA